MVDYQELSWILCCVFVVTLTILAILRSYRERREYGILLEKLEAETDYYKKVIEKMEGVYGES